MIWSLIQIRTDFDQWEFSHILKWFQSQINANIKHYLNLEFWTWSTQYTLNDRKCEKKMEKEKNNTRNKILFFFWSYNAQNFNTHNPTKPTNFRLACYTLYNSLPEREVSLDTHVYKTTISKAHRNLTLTLVFLEGVPATHVIYLHTNKTRFNIPFQ